MGVGVSGCLFVWAVDGSGPAGGLPLRKDGRLVVSRGFVARGCGWLVRVGVGNTPVMLLLPACVGSGAWWVLSRVWGWHAVGVLGQCALGCPARPGFHFLGFWVGVGGLVVNCIVDASILL